MQKISIYIILFLSLFGGLIFSLGVPTYFSIINEGIIYSFLVLSMLARSGKGMTQPHLWQFAILFLFVTVLSIMINEMVPTRSLFSLRLLFRFYIFYLAIIWMDPNDEMIKHFNRFILILLILQFPIVAVKFMKYGISEKTSGGYAVHDGSIATTLPISFIFYLAAFYYLYSRKFLYVLVTIGYIICSIVAEKRAVFFLYPIQFIIIFQFIYLKSEGINLSKKIFAFTFFAFFTIILSASILYFNETLNPDKEVGGEIDLSYALEYAQKYNAGIDGWGYSYGRIATTERVIEVLFEAGFKQVLLGLGPGVTTPSFLDSAKEKEKFWEEYDKFKIGYGWTTMNRIAMEYGLLGFFIFTWMLISICLTCIKLYRKEIDPYWKAFATGSVCFTFSMLFFAFTYHWTTFWGDTMPVLYFYSMAVVYIRYHYRGRSV